MAAKVDRPPVFWRARTKIIEELAIKMVCDSIGEEGEIKLPQEWYKQAELQANDLKTMIIEEAAKDEDYYYATKR
jgi:hypothetical protein